MTKVWSEYKQKCHAKMGRFIDKVGNTLGEEGVNRRISMFNLPYGVDIGDIEEFFGKDGIEGITLYEKVAFVQFKRPCNYTEALLKNKFSMRGKQIVISTYKRESPDYKRKRPSPPIRRVSSPVASARLEHNQRERSRSGDRDLSKRLSRGDCRERSHHSRDRSRDHRTERSSSCRDSSIKRRDSISTRRESSSSKHESSSTKLESSLSHGDNSSDRNSRGHLPLAPLSGAPIKAPTSEHTWGATTFPTPTTSFPMPYHGSNLGKIFADQPPLSMMPVPVAQPVGLQPMQQYPVVLRQSQMDLNTVQTQSTDDSIATTATDRNNSLVLPQRIALLLRLVMIENSISGISLDQARELEQFVVKVRKTMEMQANNCSIKLEPSQSGESATGDEPAKQKEEIIDVTEEAQELAKTLRDFRG